MKPRVEQGLLRLAITHAAFYAIDIGFALAGFVIGFGLEVRSWPALIGFAIASRWVFSVSRGIWENGQQDRYTGFREIGFKALRDVVLERRRQIKGEGWTAEHDDEHATGELERAAAAYALAGSSEGRVIGDELDPSLVARVWPWGQRWWKPKADRRRNLVRAAALLLAAIEREDRARAAAKKKEWEVAP